MAQMKIDLTPWRQIILADTDTSVVIPKLPDQHIPAGFQIQVVDNKGTAGSANIVVSDGGGAIGSGTTTTISSAFGSARLTSAVTVWIVG